MDIRSKITLPMILLPLISSLAVLIVCIVLFMNEAEQTQNNMLTSAVNTFENDLEDNKHDADQAARSISSDIDIIGNFDNNKKLTTRSETLLVEMDVDFIVVTDEIGKTLVCTFDPGKKGTSYADVYSVRGALGGNPTTVIDTGNDIKLSVHSTYPVYDTNNKLKGTVTAGLRFDTEEYVESMKKLTGSEVTMSLANERVATTVLDDDGERAVGTKVSEEVWDEVSAGGTYIGETEILGKNAVVEYKPLKKNNEIIGMFFVGFYTESIDKSVTQFVIIGSIVAVILAIVAIFVGFMVSGRIVRPIRKLVDIAHKLASGRVDIDIDVTGKDETAELTKAFAEMVKSFRMQAEALSAIAAGDYTTTVIPQSSEDIVGHAIISMLEKNKELLNEIRSTSEQVAKGSAQIATGAQELSSGSAEQTATIQKFVETLNELKHETENTDKLADDTSLEIIEAGRLMDESMEQMNQMSQAMKEIDTGSKSIADIIQLIDGIAFQTNILSLNAAVEAARAGAHGKGFAVVAGEVRSLAVKSADAAKATTELITASLGKVEQGNHITALTAESLSKVARIAQSNAESMKEINKSSSLQTDRVNEITEAIEQISSVVEANSAAAEENAAAAEEMSAQSTMLDQTVSRFKTK